MKKIFILDDEKIILESLKAILETENLQQNSLDKFEVTTSSNPVGALCALRENNDIDILLIDLKMPQLDGINFLKQLKDSKFSGVIIAMSASGVSDLALEAIKNGAVDFLTKPFSKDELLFCLRKNIHANVNSAKTNAKSIAKEQGIISQDAKMKEVLETIIKIANFNTTVLITGESGTGKELVARAIHNNSSRKNKKFVAINCGAIPETLLETELFGHKKGSFTDAKFDKKGLFEEAHGGTIFLDEIGDLPFLLQVKLLRVLQERIISPIGSNEQIPIDVRIITATLKNLEDEVRKGNFREDLLYRLNVINVRVPPLRERKGDIKILIEHFLEKNAAKFNIQQPTITDDAVKALIGYEWNGNIRELENCIERAMVLKTGDVITIDDLPNKVFDKKKKYMTLAEQIEVEQVDLSIKTHTVNIEKTLILKALEQTGGNRTQAARLLEISHRALLYKIKEYDIN